MTDEPQAKRLPHILAASGSFTPERIMKRAPHNLLSRWRTKRNAPKCSRPATAVTYLCLPRLSRVMLTVCSGFSYSEAQREPAHVPRRDPAPHLLLLLRLLLLLALLLLALALLVAVLLLSGSGRLLLGLLLLGLLLQPGQQLGAVLQNPHLALLEGRAVLAVLRRNAAH